MSQYHYVVCQMGQYLLTVPQHLEPLLVSPSPALNRALQQLQEAAPGSVSDDSCLGDAYCDNNVHPGESSIVYNDLGKQAPARND